jgi:hypothetical protein
MTREHEGGHKSGEHSGGGAAGRDDRQHQTALAAGVQQRRQAAANHYNQAHPEEVAEFNRLTKNACGEGAYVDFQKVWGWQSVRGLTLDGKVGPETLAAARKEAAGSGGDGAEGEKKNPESGGVAVKPEGDVSSKPKEHEPPKQAGRHEAATEEPQPHKKAPKQDSGAEEADGVAKLAEEIGRQGLTPELEERLDHLTPRAMERLIELLKSHGKTEQAKQILARVKQEKKDKDEHKGLAPHLEGVKSKKKEHYSGDKRWGELHNDTKAPAKYEFTYDKAKGQEGTLRTGDEARAHEADHRKQESAEKEEAKARLGPAGSRGAAVASKVHSTLWEGKTKKFDKAVVDDKEKFGDAEHWGGDVHDRALGFDAQAGGEVDASWEKGIKVSGNANAKATLVSGGAQVHTPPFHFQMGGEQFIASFNFFVDGGVLAEAKGNIAVNLHPKGEAGIEAGISGFAGAKIAASASGTLDWVKKSPATYAEQIATAGGGMKLLDNVLPGSVAHNIPKHAIAPVLDHVIPYLLGTSEGDSLVLGATARGEGRLGAGADAGFAARFKGGVLHCHGKAGLTFGAGLGGEIDLQLGVIDGMALLTLLGMKGSMALMNGLKPAMNIATFMKQHEKEIVQAVILYCQAAQKDPQQSRWAKLALRALGGYAALHAADAD